MEIVLSQRDLSALASAKPDISFDDIVEIRFTINDHGEVVDCKAPVTKLRDFTGPGLVKAAEIAIARWRLNQSGQQCKVIEFPKRAK